MATSEARQRLTVTAPQELDPGFRSWLKRTREAHGDTSLSLSKKSGLSSGVIQDLEAGRRANSLVPVHTFIRLAIGLNLDLGYVLHKAGFEVGRDGINMERLDRIEMVVDRLDVAESAIRHALAESVALIDLLGDDGDAVDRLRTGDDARGGVRPKLLAALAELDLVTERLRKER